MEMFTVITQSVENDTFNMLTSLGRRSFIQG